MAQVEYTAFRCIQMVSGRYGILNVVPEVGDDVLIERKDCFELHQVKTRSETQGSWLASEVVPIFVKQLLSARRLDKPSRCVFVSNASAANSDSQANFYNFSNFKRCIEARRRGAVLTNAQRMSFQKARHAWTEAITAASLPTTPPFTKREVLQALKTADFQTSSNYLVNPLEYGGFSAQNLIFLDRALEDAVPGCPALSRLDLERMYAALLLLIIETMATRKRGDDRRIGPEEVKTACFLGEATRAVQINLDAYQGRNIAQKKANLAGFDPTSFPLIDRQRKLAQVALRELATTHDEQTIDVLVTELLEEHEQQRSVVSAQHPGSLNIGRKLFKSLQDRLESLNYTLLSKVGRLDRSTYFGIIWEEANQCHAWLHGTEECALP